MPVWMDVLSVVTLAILAFVIGAYAYRLWRIVRRNEDYEAGGSMGDQMLGRPRRPRRRA